jgi:hypothetical protein
VKQYPIAPTLEAVSTRPDAPFNDGDNRPDPSSQCPFLEWPDSRDREHPRSE